MKTYAIMTNYLGKRTATPMGLTAGSRGIRMRGS